MKKTWILAGFIWALVIAVYQSPLWGVDSTLALLCLVGSVLSIGPFVRWAYAGMPGVPVFEVFCGLHLNYYFNAYWTVRDDVMVSEPEIRQKTLLATITFLLACSGVFYTLTFHKFPSHLSRLKLLDRGLPNSPGSLILWLLLVISWVFHASLVFGFSPDWGSAYNTIRAICTACGILGVFLLAGALKHSGPGPKFLFWVLVITRTLLEWHSGFLVNGGFFLGIVFLSILLQQKKLPYVGMVCAVLLMSFLHKGKEAMRHRFWDGESQGTVSEPPWVVFPYWIAASWAVMNGESDGLVDQAPVPKGGILTRASLGVYLSRVLEMTPDPLPHLNGLTYAQFIPLIVPRFLNPNKPNGNLPVDTLTVYYGVLTEEGSKKTSVALGLIAEGWANFGWSGVVFEAGTFGFLFAIVAGFSRERQQNSVGYVLGLGFLAQAMNIENAIAAWAVQGIQAGGVILVVVYFMSQVASVKWVVNDWSRPTGDGPQSPNAPDSNVV